VVLFTWNLKCRVVCPGIGLMPTQPHTSMIDGVDADADADADLSETRIHFYSQP
jgi:hypothetical protein